jgi:hypothetical protein
MNGEELTPSPDTGHPATANPYLIYMGDYETTADPTLITESDQQLSGVGSLSAGASP